MQHCFFFPGPPYLGLSRQDEQLPQSCSREHPSHSPRRDRLRDSIYTDVNVVKHIAMVTIIYVCKANNACSAYYARHSLLVTAETGILLAFVPVHIKEDKSALRAVEQLATCNVYLPHPIGSSSNSSLPL